MEDYFNKFYSNIKLTAKNETELKQVEELILKSLIHEVVTGKKQVYHG